MATRFKIRRSSTYTGSVSAIPVSVGELSYIYAVNNNYVTNTGHKLYIGTGTETSLQASTIESIGGSYYTALLDHVPGTLTANAAVLVDADKRLDELNLKTNGALSLFNTANTFKTVLKSNPTLAADTLFQLPDTNGSSGQFLTTNGSGVLSWVSVNNSAITLTSNSATAFTLNDGGTNYLTVSTLTGSESISLGNSTTVLSNVIQDNTTSAYLVKSTADNYIRINTTDGNELVAFDTGNVSITNDLIVNGGDITSTATTFNLLNAGVTTLNIGGAATALVLGATTGTTTVRNNLVITGNLTINGTTTQVNTTNLSVEDALIDLGIVDGSVPTSNLGLDLGLRINYYDTAARISSVFWDVSSSRFVLASKVTETSGVLSVTVPTSTVNDYASLEVGNLYLNDFACDTLGTAETVVGYATINGVTGRHLQNILIDGGVF